MNKKIKINFWGVRGSVPCPGKDTVEYGGNTPCISFEYENKLIILDAGSGIRMLGKNLLQNKKITNNDLYIFISHTHWDHIQGLPFLASAFIKGNKIRIFGPKLFNQSFKEIMSSQMEYSYFPIRLEDMEADINFSELIIGQYKDIIKGVTVDAFLSNHPVICMGYKFTLNKKSIVYVPDTELFIPEFFKFICKTQRQNNIKMAKLAVADLIKDFEKQIKNCDLLIIDAFSKKEEYSKMTIGWGHSCYQDIYELAKKNNVKNLCFFHHNPNTTDSDLKSIEKYYINLNKKEKCFDSIFAAKENTDFIL